MTKPIKPLTDFGRYLEDHGIAVQDAADELGVAKAYIYMLSHGTQTPGLKLAWEIEQFSNSVVRMQSWIRHIENSKEHRDQLKQKRTVG